MTFLRFFALRSSSSTTTTTNVRSIALSPVVVSLRVDGRNLGRDNVNGLYCLLIQDELHKIFPFLDPVWFWVCDRLFFASSSSYPRLSPSNGTSRGDRGIGGSFVYVVDDAMTRERGRRDGWLTDARYPLCVIFFCSVRKRT